MFQEMEFRFRQRSKTRGKNREINYLPPRWRANLYLLRNVSRNHFHNMLVFNFRLMTEEQNVRLQKELQQKMATALELGVLQSFIILKHYNRLIQPMTLKMNPLKKTFPFPWQMKKGGSSLTHQAPTQEASIVGRWVLVLLVCQSKVYIHSRYISS